MLLTKSLVILCSAAVATARVFHYDAIATGALFLGRDTSDPSASPYDVFSDSKNHATAIASISVRLARQVNFLPSHQWTDDTAYSEFRSRVSTFKGFKLDSDESTDLTFNGHDELKEKVAEFYGEVEGDKVAAALGNIVWDHLEKDPSKNWAFTTFIVHQPEGGLVQFEMVELTIVRPDDMSFESIHHRQGEYAAKLNVLVFEVRGRILSHHAHELAQRNPKVSIAEFIKFFTTPASSKGSLEAWLEDEKSQNTGQQTSFTRRPHALYPRI